MKRIALLIALSIIAVSASAAQYTGKKFKVTITKQADGQRVVEGEVWDTTKSEHTLVIHTKPATNDNATVNVNPETGKLEFK